MDNNLKSIQSLLLNKSVLKQNIAGKTQEIFDSMKEILAGEIGELRQHIEDPRIRLSAEDRGDHEMRVMIGSDTLFFQKHSNVFLLEDEDKLWEDEAIKADKSLAYFGVVHVYNFLADSILSNRQNDSGFLIGRVFVNKNGNLMAEGPGQLGTLFQIPSANPPTSETLKHIIQCALAHALDFDLLTPKYSIIEEVSLAQILVSSSELQMKTSKRLGFKQKNVQKV
jgi:hypothetical protein